MTTTLMIVESTETRDPVIIRWPAPVDGVGLRAWQAEITDAATGKQLLNVARGHAVVSFDPDALVYVTLEQYTGPDGEPSPVPVIGDDGEPATGSFTYPVARMDVSAER